MIRESTETMFLGSAVKQLVYNGEIPVTIFYNGESYFKMVSRLSYFDNLATMIMKNNGCDYIFSFKDKNLINSSCIFS